ncbi:MAG TPA: hypothetical protein VF473_08720 [Cyclobacteriaceae bacterium]
MASLLFTQVGVGFLHDKHDAHERIDKAQRDQTQLHKHGEHCKVCSIDMFFSLFIDNGVVTIDSTPKSIQTCITHDALQSQPLRFFEGRAPPAIAV